MSVKAHLQNLVAYQGGELELLRIEDELVEIERARTVARAEIEAARQEVGGAETAVEEARLEARRFEVDLKAAEDRVAKFKDQLLMVKTNKEL